MVLAVSLFSSRKSVQNFRQKINRWKFQKHNNNNGKKYKEKGVAVLTDRRGKAKPENELTEEERLRQENKILQAKIKDQEMEIALLKKLRELRGGDL